MPSSVLIARIGRPHIRSIVRALLQGFQVAPVDAAVVNDVEISGRPVVVRPITGLGGLDRRIELTFQALDFGGELGIVWIRFSLGTGVGKLILQIDDAVLIGGAEIGLQRADAGAITQLLGQLDHGAHPFAMVAEAIFMPMTSLPAMFEQRLGFLGRVTVGVAAGTMLELGPTTPPRAVPSTAPVTMFIVFQGVVIALSGYNMSAAAVIVVE